MKNSTQVSKILLVLGDILAFTMSFLFAYWFRIKSGYFSSGYVPLSAYSNLLIFSNAMVVILFASQSLYTIRRSSSFIDEFLSIFKALFLLFLIVAFMAFVLKVAVFSRIVILLAFLFSMSFISLMRYFLSRKVTLLRKTTCVIYCKNETGLRVMKKIKNHPELGYLFAGFIKSFKDLEKYAPEVVFVTTEIDTREIATLSMKYPSIEFKLVPQYTELIIEPLSLNELQDIPLITLRRESKRGAYLFFKRIFDVGFSSILLVLIAPLFIIIIVLIRTTSHGPAIYSQQRVGKDEEPFTFYKFRTMRSSGSPQVKNESDYLFKACDDPRVTWIGKVLRRFCLDELPQLFNVLKGDMSLVGPRPHLQEELRRLSDWQKRRFEVLPGMTGLWQIGGRHELSFEKSVLLDVYYIKNMSFRLDVEVMLKTVPAILFSRMG